jgi:Amt family ammonium transporter
MNNRWLIAFFLLSLGACLGLGFSAPFPGLTEDTLNSGDVAWLLTASALVLLMTPGLSFFYAGMVRHKNLVSTMLQSFIALGVISLLWVVVGFGLAFGNSIGGEGTGIIGNPLSYFMFKGVGMQPNADFGATIPFALFALFQLKFAIITPALITGGFAERIRFSAFLLFICLFSMFIYAPLAHMTWHPNGLLGNWGVLDFAGGTVVHISAGLAALAGAIFLGKRKELAHAPSNIPFVLLGTGLLWFGWFGFNGGSALAADGVAAKAFITTNTATAAAMMAWIFFDGFTGRRPSAIGACVGAVVGLVAITPAAAFVTVGQSFFIGFSASIISNLAIRAIKHYTQIDDTLDVFACHGIGGMVGMVMTGIFAEEVGLVYGSTTTFMSHLLALVLVSVFAFGGSYLLYFITNLIIPMRITSDKEEIGLDLSQHNEQANELMSRLSGVAITTHEDSPKSEKINGTPQTATA